MKNLNQFYIDSFAAKSEIQIFKNGQHIKNAQQFRLGLNFQPNGYYEVGIYGSYQWGVIKSEHSVLKTDDYGFPIGEYHGTNKLQTDAVTTGIHATWYFSELIGFQKKENALNGLHLGLDINGGIGFSKATIDGLFPEIEKQTPYIVFHQFKDSHSFQGQLGVKVEYDLSKQPFLTTLGIRLGYQYFKTKKSIH